MIYKWRIRIICLLLNVQLTFAERSTRWCDAQSCRIYSCSWCLSAPPAFTSVVSNVPHIYVNKVVYKNNLTVIGGWRMMVPEQRIVALWRTLCGSSEGMEICCLSLLCGYFTLQKRAYCRTWVKPRGMWEWQRLLRKGRGNGLLKLLLVSCYAKRLIRKMESN